MSFSGLSDLFEGRFGSRESLAFLLSLKAPENMKEYLLERHKRAFRNVSYEVVIKRWQGYPSASTAKNIKPVLDSDLSNPKFISNLAERLSFDISRFTDFLEGYAKVAEDIKPVMLHYSMIYLLDFFSRTWLKYGQNMSHGVRMMQQEGDQTVLNSRLKISENGIFPRAVDAFFVKHQSSIFSNDDKDGIGYAVNALEGGTIPEQLPKLKCCETPQVKLGELLDIYKKLGSLKHIQITVANKILTGYLLLFSMSFISRYKAIDWFIIRKNRNLSNRIELLNQDFVSNWMPELLLQTSIL